MARLRDGEKNFEDIFIRFILHERDRRIPDGGIGRAYA